MNIPAQEMTPEQRHEMIHEQIKRIRQYLLAADRLEVLGVTFGLALEGADGKPDDDLIVAMAGETVALQLLIYGQHQQVERTLRRRPE